VLKGVMEKMNSGPLTGSYVMDVRVCLFDGKMHAVDSNDLSFKIAGMMAFKDAFQKASPLLMEPVMAMEVLCPDEVTGSILGDLQMRRGIVEGFDTEGHFTVIHAKVPHAETYQYATSLRSLTQGRARFRMKFDHYAPVAPDLQRKLVEIYKKDVPEMAEA
jgi:elongation factor G